ncbi:MAG: helix-turn-helix domain-containing protein [Candidatus Omnitrophota bacterium]
MNRRFINIQELSEYIGVSPNTVRSWVWLKQIPYHKLGRLVKFDLQEIENWLKIRKVETIK